MSDRGRLFVAIGVVLSLVTVLVVAVLFSAPVDMEKPADWAAVWTMRWAAVTALFTAISAFAIGATALYAQQAIAENRRLERVKLAREVIRRYQQDGVARAVARFGANALGYTNQQFRADVEKALMFLDECAILQTSNSIERALLFEFLGVRLVDAWRVLDRVFPRFAKLDPVSIGDLQALRQFVLDAQRYLAHHPQRETFPPDVFEPLP